MYKLHKEVSDQVPDDLMFPTAQEITKAIPEPVIPDYVLEKKLESSNEDDDK